MNWWEPAGKAEHTAEGSEMVLSSVATSGHLGGPFQVYNYILGSKVIDYLIKGVAIKFAWKEELVCRV